jgi:uncharacterized membrane protein YdbT with pleckstrin-like domain
MSYLDKILQPGEKVLVIGRLHWVIFLRAYLMLAAAFAVGILTRLVVSAPQQVLIGYAIALLLLVLGVVAVVGQALARAATEMVVTDHRVIVKRGLLSLHTVEMNTDKVESVDVDQSFLGQMLGYGTVTVHGTGARWDPITLLADPLAFRNAITSH